MVDLLAMATLAGDASFTLFNYLPAELRLEIWRQSCQPRVVEVCYSKNEDRCRTNTRPPILLQVSREARHECLKIYRRSFGTQSSPALIYFSPALDILYVPRQGDMGYSDIERDFAQHVLGVSSCVRNLAIDHVKAEVRRPWETYSKYSLMRNFPYLERTFLVLSSTDEGWEFGGRGQLELVDPKEDKGTIMRLMENVLQSFSYEIGLDMGPCNDGTGCEAGRFELPVALIPKRKSLQMWPQQPSYISCV